MKSTGEVMGMDVDLGLAYAKSQMAAPPPLPKKGNVFLSVKDTDKESVIPVVREFVKLGFGIISTSGTAATLAKAKVKVKKVFKLHEGRPNVLDRIKNGDINFIINTPSGKIPREHEVMIRNAALAQKIPIMTTVRAAQASANGIRSLQKRKMKMSILAMFLLSSALFAAEEKKEDTSPVSTGNEVAVIKTSEGDMVVEFWTDAAPNTIENFKKLARAGFYNGTIFHRIVKAFMIQGGDPNSKDPSKENRYGEGGPGYKIKAEFNDHSHERGVISMAREPDPDSGGSQFFICLAPVPRLDHQYTTFGKLIKGDDVLEKIGDTPVTKNSRGEQSKPTKRVVIESVKIVPAESVK